MYTRFILIFVFFVSRLFCYIGWTMISLTRETCRYLSGYVSKVRIFPFKSSPREGPRGLGPPGKIRGHSAPSILFLNIFFYLFHQFDYYSFKFLTYTNNNSYD